MDFEVLAYISHLCQKGQMYGVCVCVCVGGGGSPGGKKKCKFVCSCMKSMRVSGQGICLLD